MLYENSNKKGTLTTTNNPLLVTSTVIPYFKILFLFYNISKKPIRTLAGINGIIDLENTFDDQGFIKSSKYQTGNEPVTFNFNYIKL